MKYFIEARFFMVISRIIGFNITLKLLLTSLECYYVNILKVAVNRNISGVSRK